MIHTVRVRAQGVASCGGVDFKTILSLFRFIDTVSMVVVIKIIQIKVTEEFLSNDHCYESDITHGSENLFKELRNCMIFSWKLNSLKAV